MSFLNKTLGNNAHLLGMQAESQACDFLISKGLKLVQRNYRCKMGEIDLVMKDKTGLVFVEVRYRKLSGFGDGLESITHSKRKKLVKASLHYLQAHKLFAFPCRFDVIAVTKGALNMVWIKNAFQVDQFL